MERAGWIESWLSLIRRRWLSGFVVGTAVMALAAGLVLLSRPIHRAQARLRLGEPPPMSGVSPTAGFFGLIRMGGDPFANDLELLGSRSLVEAVIGDVALNAKLVAPRGWHRDSIFTAFTADTTTGSGTWEAEWLPDGRIDIRRIAPADSAGPAATAAAGRPVSFGGVTAAFRPWRTGAPRTVRIQTVPPGLAVLNNGPRLRAVRTRRDANVVELAFDDPDPALARAVIASMIDRFIALRTAIQQRESRTTVDSLRSVAASTQVELTGAEASLEAWQRETRLVQPEIQGEVFAERYGTLLEQLELARVELAAIVAITDRLAAGPDSTLDFAGLLAHPRFLENETIGLLLARLTGLQDQRAELLTRRTPDSREVRLIDGQIRALGQSLRAVAGDFREALSSRLATLEARASEMDLTLAGTPAQAIELGRRQRAIRLLSEIILLTEQRLRQEELREALTFSNVQVIDPPALRFKPVWPRRTLGMAVGLLLATGSALLALVAAEQADRRVRRAERIEAILGAPVVAVTVAGGRAAPALGDAEVAAIARRVATGDGRVWLAATAGDRRSDAHVRALAGADGGPGDGPRPRLVGLMTIGSFAAAAATGGKPVVLVVSCGRTRADALTRSRRLLEAAGCAVAGAIVVCEDESQAAALWT